MRYIRPCMRNKKVLFTIVYIVLLVLLYGAIFSLSAQDGETSGSLSMKVSGKCTEILEDLSGEEWDSQKETEMAEGLEKPLRKMAHFTEYAYMGVLVYLLWAQWLSKRKSLYVISAAWVFVSAVLDEFHQSFVPGRFAGFSDVCIDMFGGIVGVVFVLFVQKALHRKRDQLPV